MYNSEETPKPFDPQKDPLNKDEELLGEAINIAFEGGGIAVANLGILRDATNALAGGSLANMRVRFKHDLFKRVLPMLREEDFYDESQNAIFTDGRMEQRDELVEALEKAKGQRVIQEV